MEKPLVSIAVTVYKSVLDSFSVFVVHLLIEIERVWLVTYLMALAVAYTDTLIFGVIIGGKLGYFTVIPGDVITYVP